MKNSLDTIEINVYPFNSIYFLLEKLALVLSGGCE